MTNQELKEQITGKFISILYKLLKLIINDLTKETYPQFRLLISGCMEIMERNNVIFPMNNQQREEFNALFIKIGSDRRITQKNNNGRALYKPYNDNLEQLINDYKLLEQVDDFLSAIEKTNNILMIKNIVTCLFNGIGANQNYINNVSK